MENNFIIYSIFFLILLVSLISFITDEYETGIAYLLVFAICAFVLFLENFENLYTKLLASFNYLQLLFLKNEYFKKEKDDFWLYNQNVIVIYDSKLKKLNVKNLLAENQEFYMDSIRNAQLPINSFIKVANDFCSDTTYKELMCDFQSQKIHTICHISNERVLVTYKRKTDELNVINLFDKKQNFSMDNSNSYKKYYIFYIISQYFNKNTSYSELLYDFFEGQDIKITVFGKKEKQNITKTKCKRVIPTITINSYSQEDFAKLPGINIAQGKRAIKYRSENNGFKTKEEFYKIVKLTKYFIEVLDSSIIIDDYDVLNEYQIEEIETQLQEGRQVDF